LLTRGFESPDGNDPKKRAESRLMRFDFKGEFNQKKFAC
jgi:hypothetical protein